MKETKNEMNQNYLANQKLLKDLKFFLPQSHFVYDWDHNAVYSKSGMYHKNSGFHFYLVVQVSESNRLSAVFTFGRAPINIDTLSLLNSFNQKCPIYFRAFIKDNNDEEKYAFMIKYSINCNNNNPIKVLFTGIKWINYNLRPLIEPFYKHIHQNTIPTSEMC